jgi:hypothetical protein
MAIMMFRYRLKAGFFKVKGIIERIVDGCAQEVVRKNFKSFVETVFPFWLDDSHGYFL